MSVNRLIASISIMLTAMFSFSVSAVADRIGMPSSDSIDLQEPANELARRSVEFHDLLMVIITVISLFVLALLVIVAFKFRESANPTPSKTTHNTVLEVVWTGLPILILVAIAIPSFRLLYYQDVIPETEFVVHVTGNQWNWTYAYPDHDGIEFTAVVVPNSAYENAPTTKYNPEDKAEYEAGLSAFLGRPAVLNARLLDTDTRLVVPVDTKIRIQLTASDVIHSWTVPSFGLKLDAVPGRLNETWFEVDEIGTYYGQCSELCGTNHAYMPIAVEVMSKADFAKWVELAKAEYAEVQTPKTTTALGR